MWRVMWTTAWYFMKINIATVNFAEFKNLDNAQRSHKRSSVCMFCCVVFSAVIQDILGHISWVLYLLHDQQHTLIVNTIQEFKQPL